MLECPANYFGKGENYILPDKVEIIQEFERRFKEWEETHPLDPTGELALADAKKRGESTVQPLFESKTKTIQPLGEETKTDITEDDWGQVRFQLPEDYIELLKNYCKYKRRRPRDILMAWIDQHCKL